jgi:hypothetical protein
MKRIQLYAAGVVVALVPAVVGLAGNASFSQSVPVRSPERARTTGTTPAPSPTHDANDDRGRRHGGHGADDAVPGSGVTSSTPTDDATHDANDANDDHGRRHGGHGADDPATHDASDDHGGDRRRQAEAGDDNGGNRGSGSDSSSSSRSGSDDSGHHSEGDDSGSGGHGSDD